MLLINIAELLGVRDTQHALRGMKFSSVPKIENAYLRIEGDRIADFGTMDSLNPSNEQTMDCRNRYVFPAWCDSHTHLVFAGSRENEFVDKIRGMSYEEIAKRGGGILNTVSKINSISKDELFIQSWKRLEEIKNHGTGAVEIKSGYGLTLEGELKILRTIKRLKEKSSMQIKSTFLGAHTYPAPYKENHQTYINIIIDEMLPVIAKEKLADYMDVFCEKEFYSPEETEQLLQAGKRFGLKAKIHANQLYNSGGVQVGVKNNAISVDHLETIGDEEIQCLKHSQTIATLLPSAAFFLRMTYPPARKMIDENIAIAIASDYNPGSSPSGNIPFLFSLSCIQMKMTPEEALNGLTHNGACAMELQHEVGSISVGKKANIILTKPIPSFSYFPYSFGENLIENVIINGELT